MLTFFLHYRGKETNQVLVSCDKMQSTQVFVSNKSVRNLGTGENQIFVMIRIQDTH